MNMRQQNFLARFGSSDHLDKLLDTNTIHKDDILSNPHVKDSHIDKLSDSTEPYVQMAVIRHPLAKAEHIHKILENNKYSLHSNNNVLMSGNKRLQELEDQSK